MRSIGGVWSIAMSWMTRRLLYVGERQKSRLGGDDVLYGTILKFEVDHHGDLLLHVFLLILSAKSVSNKV